MWPHSMAEGYRTSGEFDFMSNSLLMAEGYPTSGEFDSMSNSLLMAEEQRYRSALSEYEDRKRQVEQYLGRALTFTELQQVAGLYAKGGEYGAGLRGLAEEGERKGLAQYQGAAVAAGMSSSAGALNQMTESSRRLRLRYAEIEDMRIDKYARALETLGTTKTTGYLTASQIMGSLTPPTVSSVASPTAQTTISGKAGITQAGISGKAGITQAGISGQAGITQAKISGKAGITQAGINAAAQVASAQINAASRNTGTQTAAPAATEESSGGGGSGFEYASTSVAPKYPSNATVVGPGNIYAKSTVAGGTGWSAYTNMMSNLGLM